MIVKAIGYVGIFFAWLGDLLVKFSERLEIQGWRSARIYIKGVFVNLWLTARNHWHRRDRVQCPHCGWQGHDFMAFDCGKWVIFHAECPHCKTHGRHRMLTLYLQRCDKTLLEARGLVLHCAPEGFVRDLLLRNPNLLIIGTDYDPRCAARFPGPALVADIQQLPLADNTFALVFCVHVMEHVRDDRKGFAELARVLKPGGVAYIMVPFAPELKTTDEYGAPDPFMFDHMRTYSPMDFELRLAPFTYEKITRADFLSPEETLKYGICADEVLFRCVKPFDS